MQKKFYLVLPFLLLHVLNGTVLQAQKPVKKVVPATANYKRPQVQTWLGKINANTSLSVTDAGQLLMLPLKIMDDKNAVFVLSSYQFAYKRIGVTEDEATGKTSAQTGITADRFTTTPLPDVWQKNIMDGLHTGEELYFFDIIVFDKQGRRFFAPELKITIQ